MHFEPTLLWAIVLLPLAGFVANGLAAFVAPDRKAIPSAVGPGVVGIAFVIALVNFMRMLGAELHEPVVEMYWTWLETGGLSVDAALQLDQLSMLMTLIVTGVGFLIHVFSVGYMKDDDGYARYFAYLNLFVFFMLVLVLGASFPLMFVGWEGVGLCSYLLIGFWFREKANADAGKKAFIVNRIGDFGFLVAMFLIFANLGSLDFVDVFERAPALLTYAGPVVTAIALFLFLGAAGKSAQIPLYVWLPDAMAGPTPVSALIHAATMVTAGVYLVARAGVLFAMAPAAQVTVAGVGALTALFAATIALAQNDIKKVLAYSTVSQLGYMFVGVGVGAFAAGIFHLMTHAFFKALLFLGAGAVIHAMHEAYHAAHDHGSDAQDMRNMGGLRRHMPITWATMWAATLAIAGVWPFAGFFSKDEIIWQAVAHAVGPHAPWYTAFWALALAAAVLTAFYMTRLMILTFHGENRTFAHGGGTNASDAAAGAGHDGGEKGGGPFREAPAVMWVPLAVLAVLSVVGGWVNVPHAIADAPVLGWLPSAEWLHAWLHPVVEPAEQILATNVGPLRETAPAGGGELTWAIVSLVLAVSAILVAVRVVGRRAYRPAAASPEPQGLARVLARKWYVDEAYDALVVRPLLRLSRGLWRAVDQGLIDGAVNGVGRLAGALGMLGARIQTGQLNTYAYAVTIGALILLAVVIF
ncbi:MAG: NADH-quinone oxidoreductase subunit L [Gemmatimonadota bacterium]